MVHQPGRRHSSPPRNGSGVLLQPSRCSQRRGGILQRHGHAKLLRVHLMRTHMVLKRNEPDCLHFCKHKPTRASARQKPTETSRSLLYPDKLSFALPRRTENRCNRQDPGKNHRGAGR